MKFLQEHHEVILLLILLGGILLVPLLGASKNSRGQIIASVKNKFLTSLNTFKKLMQGAHHAASDLVQKAPPPRAKLDSRKRDSSYDLILSTTGSDGKRLEFRLDFQDPEKKERGLTIGRRRDIVDYSLPDNIPNNTSVSRRHMRIGWQEQEIYVEDLNSSGTSINDSDKKIPPYQRIAVKIGDFITLGHVRFLISKP